MGSKMKILLIGDLIIDIHHFGKDGGISNETGGPVGIHKETKVTWGGAGLVARNILELGGELAFATVAGGDEAGAAADRLTHKRLRKIFLKEKNRQTITKERFLIGGKKVFRWNRGDGTSVSNKIQNAILSYLRKDLKSFDKIIISDYRHGLLTKKFAEKIIRICHEAKKPVYVDSQMVRTKSNIFWYKGADLICLNQNEAAGADPRFDGDDLKQSIKRLSRKLKSENIIVKLGDRGSAALFGNQYVKTPAFKVKAVDPIGAGDAFLAALAISPFLIKEKTLVFANKWAALATTIQGTEPPKRIKLKA